MSDEVTIINDHVFAFDKNNVLSIYVIFYQNDKISLKT